MSRMDLSLIPTSPSLDNLEELFKMFFAGKNPATMRGYRSDLELFRQACGFPTTDATIKALLSNGNGHANLIVMRYINELKEKKQAPATINRKLASLRALIAAARTIGLITWGLDVRSQRVEQKDMRGPERDGVVKIIEAAKKNPNPITAARDTAIIWLLFGLALRRGEVSSLNAEHITDKCVMVMGKGKKIREPITLTDSVRDALKVWAKVRPVVRGETQAPVFISLSRASFGHRLTTHAIYNIVQGYGKLAGVGNVRPHGLRHSAITLALDVSNGNIQKVQRFSRHANYNMVQKYDDNRKDLGGEIASEMDALFTQTPPKIPKNSGETKTP